MCQLFYLWSYHLGEKGFTRRVQVLFFRQRILSIQVYCRSHSCCKSLRGTEEELWMFKASTMNRDCKKINTFDLSVPITLSVKDVVHSSNTGLLVDQFTTLVEMSQ